jgi:hypothetical protein
MDVSVQLASQSAVPNATEPRPLGQGLNAAEVGGLGQQATATPMSQAFANAKTEAPNVAGIVDRLRADFEAFRARLQQPSQAANVPVDGRSSVQQLSDMMDRSIRTQVDMLELGISLNAGITAAQQSQSGIKTLIEKS